MLTLNKTFYAFPGNLDPRILILQITWSSQQNLKFGVYWLLAHMCNALLYIPGVLQQFKI